MSGRGVDAGVRAEAVSGRGGTNSCCARSSCPRAAPPCAADPYDPRGRQEQRRGLPVSPQPLPIKAHMLPVGDGKSVNACVNLPTCATGGHTARGLAAGRDTAAEPARWLTGLSLSPTAKTTKKALPGANCASRVTQRVLTGPGVICGERRDA